MQSARAAVVGTDRVRPALTVRVAGDLVLERVPQVCLFVRAENGAAIGLYEKVGMKHVLDYRSVLL